MPAKGSSFWVFVFGYLMLAAGITSAGWDIYGRVELLMPREMGTVIGECALILTGLLAIIIGQSLQRIEKQLEQFKSGRKSD